MKKVWVTLAVLAFAVAAQAQEKNFIDVNYIEINGRVEREMTPDEIYVSIVIVEKDNKGKASVDQQERDMIRQLQGLNLDLDRNLVVQDMASEMARRNNVYTSKAYQLKLSTATQLTNVFQLLNGMGISDINIDRTALSNIDEVRDELRVEAAQSARTSAQKLAEAMGRTLGKAIYIQDYGYNNIRAYGSGILAKSAVTMDMEVIAVDQRTQLDFQKINLEYTVMLRFALE